MTVNCSFLENVLFDYQNGDLPLDNLAEDHFQQGLSWNETQAIIYWWLQAKKQGVMSIAHCKLAYVVQDIISNHESGCNWNQLPTHRWDIN